MVNKYCALDGTKAEHTPAESPDCYDRFTVYRSGWSSKDKVMKSDKVIHHRLYRLYSMRLFHDESQWFSGRDPELIQMLLSMILERPVILTGIEEENNRGSGYPCWYFYYKEAARELALTMKAGFFDLLLERDRTRESDLKKRAELRKTLFSKGFII